MSLSLEMTFLLFSSLYIKLLCEKNPCLWISFLKAQQNHSIDIFKMDGLKSIRSRDASRFLQWSWKNQHHQGLIQCNSAGVLDSHQMSIWIEKCGAFLRKGFAWNCWAFIHQEKMDSMYSSSGTVLGPSVHNTQRAQTNSLEILELGICMMLLIKDPKRMLCCRIARNNRDLTHRSSTASAGKQGLF